MAPINFVSNLTSSVNLYNENISCCLSTMVAFGWNSSLVLKVQMILDRRLDKAKRRRHERTVSKNVFAFVKCFIALSNIPWKKSCCVHLRRCSFPCSVWNRRRINAKPDEKKKKRFCLLSVSFSHIVLSSFCKIWFWLSGFAACCRTRVKLYNATSHNMEFFC